MSTFSYSWRDLALCFRTALSLQRIALGVQLVVICLLTWWLASATPVVWLPQAIRPPLFAPIPEQFTFVYLGALGVISWWFVSRLFVTLGRSAALDLCASRSSSFKSLRIYRLNYARYHTRAPLAIALYALPFCLPLLLWSFAGSLGSIGATIAAITSPIALILALIVAGILVLGVTSLPLQAAGVAVHGTDTYDNLSRAVMYTSMTPHRYLLWYTWKLLTWIIAALVVALALAGALALFAASIALFHGEYAAYELVDVTLGVMPYQAVQALDPHLALGAALSFWFLALIGSGYLLAFDAASDIVVFLLVRHWCDATPVTEYFDPVRAFQDKATKMERREAEKALGSSQIPEEDQSTAVTSAAKPS